MSFDYIMLNFFGHVCNSAYNTCMLFDIGNAKRDYLVKYEAFTIPVRFNDVIFAVHSSVVGAILVIQCYLYEVGFFFNKQFFVNFFKTNCST